MHAFAPFNPCLMPMWPSTLLGSVRRSHIGLTVFASSRPKAGSSPWACGKQREIVVLVLVVAAAGSDVDAGAIAVLRRGAGFERVAMSDDAGALDRASGRIESNEVRAPDELVQLAVVDQRARIEIGDFRGNAARPACRCPIA